MLQKEGKTITCHAQSVRPVEALPTLREGKFRCSGQGWGEESGIEGEESAPQQCANSVLLSLCHQGLY